MNKIILLVMSMLCISQLLHSADDQHQAATPLEFVQKCLDPEHIYPVDSNHWELRGLFYKADPTKEQAAFASKLAEINRVSAQYLKKPFTDTTTAAPTIIYAIIWLRKHISKTILGIIPPACPAHYSSLKDFHDNPLKKTLKNHDEELSPDKLHEYFFLNKDAIKELEMWLPEFKKRQVIGEIPTSAEAFDAALSEALTIHQNKILQKAHDARRSISKQVDDAFQGTMPSLSAYYFPETK